MENAIRILKEIDWDFSDYISSKYPSDINSLHWYPGSFVPQIPSILIEVLTKPNDCVLDIFAGSGITLVESSKLNRSYIGVDSNPLAIDISNAKLNAISKTENQWYQEQINEISALKPLSDVKQYCDKINIKEEVFQWFEINTLSELLAIHDFIMFKKNDCEKLILKIIFSAILNKCCSQREHYTYITDNCKPPKLIYRPAFQFYKEQVELTGTAVEIEKNHYERIHDKIWNPIDDGRVEFDDARVLETVKNDEADIIITSPPYLGVNDYTRSMKLSYIFFPEKREVASINDEIGARRKRRRKNAFEEYISDMRDVFHQVDRVLKPNSYFCMIIGQGRGKVNKLDTIQTLLDILQKELEYSLIFNKERKIKFRRIQVPGVGKESIFVLRK